MATSSSLLDELKVLQTVVERDIDLLVLEELLISEPFQHFFVRQIFGDAEQLDEFDGAWHSVTHHSLGESDLVFTFRAESGITFGVLVENKINAKFMPQQAKRYLARGKEGKTEGWWQEFTTCLMAPRRYIDGCNAEQKQLFRQTVAYEELISYFGASGSDTRAKYKAMLLSKACDNSSSGSYVMTEDEAVTEFFRNYWELSLREFPELRMVEPGPKPSGGAWVHFPRVGLPAKIWLTHKIDQDAVVLSFDRTNPEDLMRVIGDHLQPDLLVVEAGQSSVIRLRAPAISPISDFSDQEECVRESLAAAYRLLLFYRANSELLIWPLVPPSLLS